MKPRLFVLLLAPLVIALVILAFTVAQLLSPRLIEPSFSYSASSYPAKPERVCAGDVVSWQPELHVRASEDAPVIPAIVQTIYRLQPPSTRLFDETPIYAIYTSDAVLSPTLSITVPLWLAPGEYEVRVGRIEAGYYPAAYGVPFSVLVCDRRMPQGRR